MKKRTNKRRKRRTAYIITCASAKMPSSCVMGRVREYRSLRPIERGTQVSFQSAATIETLHHAKPCHCGRTRIGRIQAKRIQEGAEYECRRCGATIEYSHSEEFAHSERDWFVMVEGAAIGRLTEYDADECYVYEARGLGLFGNPEAAARAIINDHNFVMSRMLIAGTKTAIRNVAKEDAL